MHGNGSGEETFDLAPEGPVDKPVKQPEGSVAGTHVGACVHCGFDCTGVKGVVCPECGRSLMMPKVEDGEDVEVAASAYAWCAGVSLLGFVVLAAELFGGHHRSDSVRVTLLFLLAMVPASVAWLWIATRTFVDFDMQWPLTAAQIAMTEIVVLLACVFVSSMTDVDFHPMLPWNVVIAVVMGFVMYSAVLKLDTTDAALVVLLQRAIGIGVFYGIAAAI